MLLLTVRADLSAEVFGVSLIGRKNRANDAVTQGAAGDQNRQRVGLDGEMAEASPRGIRLVGQLDTVRTLACKSGTILEVGRVTTV